MDHFPTNWGRPVSPATYPLHNRSQNQSTTSGATQHTQQPIVTGTSSVLAIKFKDGIMIAADTLASYGSLARFKGVQRLHPVGDYTVAHPRRPVVSEETTAQDGHTLGPAEIHEYLSQCMNPLWNSLLVGGVKDGQRFLAYVDLLGAVEGRENTLTEPEARAILENALRVLFYRDARSINQYQIATITADGAEISASLKLETSWGFAEGIRGYGAQTQ
ncbi:proteasome endopeptidase complex beta subunit [Lactarius pseudohatsudake]|nr:proteasome endopeptidase complex beta subunit [Lactarius pseudohatsudake]